MNSKEFVIILARVRVDAKSRFEGEYPGSKCSRIVDEGKLSTMPTGAARILVAPKDDVYLGFEYSYASLYLETHGYILYTNHDTKSVVAKEHFNPEKGIYLPLADVHIKVGDFMTLTNITHKDRRVSWYMVYPFGLTEEQVLSILKPQVEKTLNMYIGMYETLVSNAKEMLNVVQSSTSLPSQHICPPMKPVYSNPIV
jgi:hypothetical protein